MLLGYNTQGMAHHRLLDAIDLLAETGYRSVAITLDHSCLNPFDSQAGLSSQLRRVRRRLEQHEMQCVIETGAWFLLDPRTRHEPTLMTPDAPARQRRITFLCRAIDIANEVGAGCVSLWSGVLHEADEKKTPRDVAMQRLTAGLTKVVRYAESNGSVLAFEPVPGMFIDTMSSYDNLLTHFDTPAFKLTLDTGRLGCLGETPVSTFVHRYAQHLANVHIADMRAGEHEHLMFGEGEVDFPPILEALRDCNYRGGVHVDLSHHSHQAPTAVQRAYDFLHPYFKAD